MTYCQTFSFGEDWRDPCPVIDRYKVISQEMVFTTHENQPLIHAKTSLEKFVFLKRKYGHCLKSRNLHTFAWTKAVKTVYGLVIAVPTDRLYGLTDKLMALLYRGVQTRYQNFKVTVASSLFYLKYRNFIQ